MQGLPAKMLVLEKAEEFGNSGEDLKFLHTTVVCEKDEGFYITNLNCSMGEVPKMLADKDEHSGTVVSPEEVFQAWTDGTFTQAQNCPSSECYVKRQSLLSFRRGDDSQINLLFQEARIMEELKSNQHPSIATYYGCVRRKNWIIGLCLERYSETLFDRVMRKGSKLDIDKCVEGIRSGIEHLHSLGFCHNDINPMNIMFKSQHDETPVIIDFDSCIRTGDQLGIKGGTPDFAEKHVAHSLQENDFYSLSRVEQFIKDNLEE